jgi:pyruvate, water dikinase
VTAVVAPALRGLAEVAATEAPEVGGKAANLGELVRRRLPVPPGFVLPAAAYLEAMDGAGVREELGRLHGSALAAADDPAGLDALCRRAAATVRRAGLPPDLVAQVRAAYAALPGGPGGATVAVRSSPVGEDGADASFAGMNATFTNVQGVDARCWESLIGALSRP